MNEFKGSSKYVVSEDLLRIVNISIALQKPLLIKGEPGTGKTMLAEAISEALGKKLIIWNIKSTTKAQDGLYVYDTVQRLYDSQFGGEGVDDIKKYIKLGKLGEAFSDKEQVILLIDEIDKADLEFPNDLLWELDKMEFYIPETKETIAAQQRPIVIITSNAESYIWMLVFMAIVFVIVGLVLPTILECWMLWLAKHEFETSRTGQMISALSDAGVLVGGFMLRLLIVSAAVPITIIQPWML